MTSGNWKCFLCRRSKRFTPGNRFSGRSNAPCACRPAAKRISRAAILAQPGLLLLVQVSCSCLEYVMNGWFQTNKVPRAPYTSSSPMVAIMRPLSLLLALALSGAMAASSSTIFFVNNSIDIPGFDSFIQMDAFSPASLKVLDGNVLPHIHCATSRLAAVH